ncbi:hypothetical protein CI109_104192 [Kwoniella shandongensis]|uniref:Killer toxin Kp4 domain-containing protein n=1 Tax=Kwoniella shandongensis TaxID=1734106 RepID=A0AAJ8LJF1_9TREE
MRLPILVHLAPLLMLNTAMAGLFGGSETTTSSSPSSTSSSGTTNSEVAFLETLQAAQITSMSCLITLVNLTTTPIGTCLGLTSLASLITNSGNSSSSDGNADIGDAKAQLAQSCASSASEGGLVGVLGTVLDNYSSSYKTLACQIHYNGTSDLCLPSVLNTSDTADSSQFFDNLVTGTILDQYKDSVFTSAQCTGCMYEMFKAAQYTIPSIRGQALTNALGDHLKNDCPQDPTYGGVVNWGDVEDQQIPDALQVSQNTQSANGVSSSANPVYDLGDLVTMMGGYGPGWVIGGLAAVMMVG